MALYSTDIGEWFVTFPVSTAFQPDPTDIIPASSLSGVTVNDGGDSDILLEWDPSEDADFGQYRVYIQDDPFTSLQGLVPSIRISDMEVDSHHMRGIRPGRTYHVAVVAVDDNRNLPSKVSPAEVEVTDTQAPPVPLDVKVFDNLDSDLLVSWDPGESPDIEEYEIYLEDSPFSDATSLEPVATVRGMQVSSFRVGGLEAGKTYHAAVAAVDWNDNVDRRVASVPGTPSDVVAPPEVRGLDASTPQAPDSEGEAMVKWSTSTADDVDHYNVYLSLTPIDSLQNFAPWGTVAASETSLVVDELNPGVKYYFAVTATDRAGHEGPSKYTVSSRASTAEPPEPVRGLSAVQAGEGSVRLTWESNNITGSPIVRYRIFMSLDPITDLADENVTGVGNASAGPDPTTLVTELEPGTTYYFCVDAVDDRGRISAGSLPSASVTLSVPPEEETDVWEVYGPYITGILVVVIIGLLAYVAMNRQRRFGRILSRRPSWEQNNNKNGGNGK
jgi:fibronectin type 3 domain-containing protein